MHPSPELSPARAELAARIAALAAASEALETLSAPAQRYAALLRASASASRVVEELRAADDLALAEWLGEPAGPRPEISPELAEAEANAVRAARDQRAASSALERLQPIIGAAGARVREAARDRDIAAVAVISEEAVALSTKHAARLHEALTVEGELEGIRLALVAVAADHETADAARSAMLAAAEKIALLRREVRERAAAPSHPEVARTFIARLRADAGARP
jgi:hypothetical protein